jgi:hypothetical protein
MRASFVAAAAVAVVAISGAALAEGVVKGKGLVVMTDAELDAVVAGVPALTVHGRGNTPGGVVPPDGNVVLGGNNGNGSPAPPGLLNGNPHAFGGKSPNAAKPCTVC